MSDVTVQFQSHGIYLPELELWLDPSEPQTGPEKVFISHAHSDHIGLHRESILSAPTAKLMQVRLGGKGLEHILKFGERRSFPGRLPFTCSLWPAGHIFGSAMVKLEIDGCSLLYTGDFKLRRGLSAEPCEPQAADILIMETTFGRPHYRFPPTDGILRGIIRFCHEALDNDETPVLLGYSLGKCQELLCGLSEAGLPLMLHGAVYELTKVYEQFGQCFPNYDRYEAGAARGKVLLCPPSVVNSAMLRNLGRTRSAILTGWAVDANCRFRYQADAAFPLSDHADFPDLIALVKAVSPRKVYTLHGFAAEFAHTLREMGFDAQALSEDEQLALSLGDCKLQRMAIRHSRVSADSRQGEMLSSPVVVGRAVPGTPSGENIRKPLVNSLPASAFSKFAATCGLIGGTSSKLEKIRLLAEYLKVLPPGDLGKVVPWFTGVAFPATENKVLQLGWALLRDGLCAVGQIDREEFHQIYLKHSDVGETAFELFSARPNEALGLSIQEIDSLFHALHAARGPTGKLPILIAVLQKCSSLEAKYLVKILTGELRIGLKEGLVEEAIARAFEVPADAVRQANLLLGNIGETALLASQKALENASIRPFRPIKFMLASPEETAEDLWKRGVSAESSITSQPSSLNQLWLEDKYDGIRCQLHKVGERVALYSRDLKDISATFPDLATAALALKADVILDGEIVAWRGEQVLPFSELQRRLGRRERDLFMQEEVPIQYAAFDVLWQNGEGLIDCQLRSRRQALEGLAPFPALIRLAQMSPARSVEEIEATFLSARARNNEGLVAKNPESVYSPGRRGLAWLKLKKALATLDCVVIGAEYGHGKRNKVLSDYTFAVRDENTGELKTIGKAYSGLTDAEIQELTEHFLRTATRQHGRYFEVLPDTVLEIAFDRLQPSARHNSGLAMRFPRIVRIRTDKSVAEIDTLVRARKLAGN